jgi:hypothetical protein
MRVSKEVLDQIKNTVSSIGADCKIQRQKIKEIEDICLDSQNSPVKYSFQICLNSEDKFLINKTEGSITKQYSFADIDKLINFIKA